MNRRRGLAIIAAVVLTLVGAVIVLGYVDSAERRARDDANLEQILVAAGEIEAGSSVEEVQRQVATREVPPSFIADDAVLTPEDFNDLGNQVTTERILAGEQIVARQFDNAAGARPGRRGGGEGREVISMLLESQRALGGDVATGDLVGIIVSIQSSDGDDQCTSETGMVLSQIEVVEVSGGVVDPESGEGGGDALMVSFDVDETEAEVLAFAAEYGSVWLTRQTDQTGNRDSDTQRCDVFEVLPGRRA